jgi:hypothetical protein
MRLNFKPNTETVSRLPNLDHIGAGITWNHKKRFLLGSGVVVPLAGAPLAVKNAAYVSRLGDAPSKQNCIKLWIAAIVALRQQNGPLSGLTCPRLLTPPKKIRLTP